jgi:CheY-like chemotaxis protein
VLHAADAQTALAILDGEPAIDLMFTDVVMPGGMNGRQLADEAAKRRPTLKVLFTTGYTRNAIIHHGRLDPGVNLIGKPYTFEELGARVRTLLDQKRG